MEPKTIILGVVVVIILYLLYLYFFSDGTSTTLVNLHDATQALTIPSSSLPGGVTSDYTFSIWLFVNSWATGYGTPKTIFQRNVNNYSGASILKDNFKSERNAINLLGEYNFNLNTKIVYGLDNESDQVNMNTYYTDYKYITKKEKIYSQYVDLQLRPTEK